MGMRLPTHHLLRVPFLIKSPPDLSLLAYIHRLQVR